MSDKNTMTQWLIASGIVVVLIYFLVSLIRVITVTATGHIGLVRIEGMIVEDRPVIKKLHKMNDHPLIKAIVIYINSPGGTMASAQSIAEEITKIRGNGKPVVVAMSEYCTSGGYYVACAADKLIANPGSITGSIGVILRYPETSQLLDKVGIAMEVVKAGRFKDIGDFSRQLTTDERQLMQTMLDDLHHQFKDMVLDRRGGQIARIIAENKKIPLTDISEKSIEKIIDSVSDGRMFTGRQALARGLVDQIGNLDDAIDIAASLGGIKNKPVVLQEKAPGFMEQLLNGRGGENGTMGKSALSLMIGLLRQLDIGVLNNRSLD